MPYDSSKPDAFRKILAAVGAGENLASNSMIAMVHRERAKKKITTPFDLTRSALDRFRKNHRIKNIAGLRELYRVLESDPDCSRYFPVATSAPPAEETFARVLTRFFAGKQPSYDLATLGGLITGSYVMYRPNFRPPTPEGRARASLITIEAKESEVTIAETQNFPASGPEAAFYQHDTGAMGAFAKFIYFLMREDAPGTAVKFGLVNYLFPYSQNALVNSFHGVLFTSSNTAIFPLSKFFCRRLETPDAKMDSGLIEIRKIKDREAREYLSTPLKLPDWD
jgi:hypothetical protein